MASPGPGIPFSPAPRISRRLEYPERATCFYCGKPLGFLSRIRGERWFCSAAHHQQYREYSERLAMEALAWNRTTRLQQQAAGLEDAGAIPMPPMAKSRRNVEHPKAAERVEPVRAAREEADLAGPVRLNIPSASGTFAARMAEPDAIVAAKARPTLLHLPAVPATKISGLGFAASLSPVLSPAACQSEIVRGRNALAFPADPIFVSRDFRPGAAVPANAARVSRQIGMLRSPGEAVLHLRNRIQRSEAYIDSISTLGVNDPEEASEERTIAAIPAVIGGPIACEPEAVIQIASQRSVRLRRSATRAPGVFIPKLRMGTLRPRVAFGPAPDRRRVIPFSGRGQRQTQPEIAARAHSA